MAALIPGAYSLWAAGGGMNLSATMLGLATIASLIVSSAASAIFTRRIMFYACQAMFDAAVKTTLVYFASGAALILAFAAASYAINCALSLYPQSHMLMFEVYFISLSLLWLSLAPLYAMRKYAMVAAIFVAGVAINNALMLAGGQPVESVKAYGLYAASAMAAICLAAYLYLKRGAKGRAKLPMLSSIIKPGLPYAALSLAYFLLLFVDRLIVWLSLIHI